MTQRGRFLFLSFLALVLLTQLLLFGWSAETVFFVTWLLLVLIVRHDSRLSPALGLALLATCPPLLIAGRDAVAEQAANYAYFFLAIGVLAQLEELLLERYARFDRRLDVSALWRPAVSAFQRGWAAAVRTLERGLHTPDRQRWTRLAVIAGGVAPAAVALWALFSPTRRTLILPLLGGALLIPFVVWGIAWVAHALGPARLLRVVFALAVLTLAAAEMIWLHAAVSAERLSRMQVTDYLIDRLDDAQRADPPPEGESIAPDLWTIDGEARRVLFHHPAFAGASRITYSVPVARGAILAFDVATAPESWSLDGDGVTFAVYVSGDEGTEQVFSTYIDPKRRPVDRRWGTVLVDLSDYAGQTVAVTLETGVGPASDYRNDWAGWGEPRLLAP